jgi:hypothetical protein
VLANQPVSFSLYASSTRMTDPAGAVLSLPMEQISAFTSDSHCPTFWEKDWRSQNSRAVSAKFTEVGTLELWCESRQTTHRWRLQFQLRGEV